MASERKVHGAVDDHGHAKMNGARKKKRGQKLLGCWELFCGDGNLTKSLRNAGLKCIDGFDILISKDFDATLSHVQRAIFKIIIELETSDTYIWGLHALCFQEHVGASLIS